MAGRGQRQWGKAACPVLLKRRYGSGATCKLQQRLSAAATSFATHKVYLGARRRRPSMVRLKAFNSSAAMPQYDTRSTPGPVAPSADSRPPGFSRRRLARS